MATKKRTTTANEDAKRRSAQRSASLKTVRNPSASSKRPSATLKMEGQNLNDRKSVLNRAKAAGQKIASGGKTTTKAKSVLMKELTEEDKKRIAKAKSR